MPLSRTRGIEPQLVAEGPAPPGGEVELAIHMRPAPGWHGYWLNPGDAGLPMDVQWRLPKGFAAGPLRYPVPTRLQVAGLMNYVYEHDYAVLARLKVPANAHGTIPVRAFAHWLACTDKICVPAQGELALDLPVGSGTPERAQFDQWRTALPRPLASIGHFAVAGDKLRVAVPLPASVDVSKPYVFPITDGVVDYEGKQAFRRAGDTLIAELPLKGPAPKDFSGVLAFGDARGLEFHAVPGAVPEGGTRLGELGVAAVLWAVLGAIAGGILLNLMPCVFPILALKALHLSRAGGDSGEARRAAFAYAAGAIVGTGALGAALLAIRAAGSEAGWAFQLQDPRTIMLLLLLAVAITANLVGLFELPVLAGGARPAGGFATGALAAFVATPCAGPFLGAALGTALLLPPAGAVLVFAALGLGLAIPFLLVAFVPRCARCCPGRAGGCSGCNASSRSRWRRPRWRASGCSIARPASRAGDRGCRAGACGAAVRLWHGSSGADARRDGRPRCLDSPSSGSQSGRCRVVQPRPRPSPVPSLGARRESRAMSPRVTRYSSISPPTGA